MFFECDLHFHIIRFFFDDQQVSIKKINTLHKITTFNTTSGQFLKSLT
jgi:hypothetical protein